MTGLILAAGTGSRLGRPKQLLPLGGRPVLQHVVDAAAAAGLRDIVLVLGHAAQEVTDALALPQLVRTVLNPEYVLGQSTSLRAGLRAAGPGARAAVVLLGDQPEVSPEAIRFVVAAFERGGRPVVQARYGGRWGHPVLLDRSVWSEVEAIEGDRGARDLLAGHPGWVVPVDLPGDPPADIDTCDDYRRLLDEWSG